MILTNVAFFKGDYYNNSLVLQYNNILNGDLEKLNKLFVEFTPDKDSVIFVDPEINLPRTKLRDYIKTTDCKLVSDLDKSNTYITNIDGLKSKFNSANYNVMKIDTLPKELFEDSLFDGFSIEEYPYKFIVLDNYHAKNFITEHVDDNFSLDIYDLINYKIVYVINDSEQYHEITGKKLVHSDILLEKVNADGLVIDEENYKQLAVMINSGESANTMLAMELMANCQYKKSAAYLLCLFYEYRYSLENQSTKKHVNFKSLLDYWSLYHNNMGVSVSQSLKLLKQKNILTIDNLDIIVKHMILKDVSIQSNMGCTTYTPASFYIEDSGLNELCNGKYLININDAKYN